jgi:DNA mismatch endonuclease (patch repair protein)
MTDVFTKDKRRQIMQSVRQENTKPETMLADTFRSAGLEFVQHPPNLPGRPDFYFPDAKVVVFVHGCFWHGHDSCAKGKNLSKSNYQYWQEKIRRNKRRDRRVARELRKTGYSVYSMWECAIKKHVIPTRLINRAQTKSELPILY